MALGIALLDGPFVGIGGMTPAYGIRGVVGADYKLTDRTTVGVYYQTEQAFRFKDAILFDFVPGDVARDVHMDLPQNIGFGVANRSLADGRLLLATDVLYKLWNRTSLFGAVYDNQWVVQVGAILGRPIPAARRICLAQNPLDPTPAEQYRRRDPAGRPACRALHAGIARLFVSAPYFRRRGRGRCSARRRFRRHGRRDVLRPRATGRLYDDLGRKLLGRFWIHLAIQPRLVPTASRAGQLGVRSCTRCSGPTLQRMNCIMVQRPAAQLGHCLVAAEST